MVKTTSPFTGLLTVVLVVISLTSSITAYYESPAIVNGIHRLWESDSSSRNSPKTNSQPCWYIAVDKSLSLQTTISNDGRSVTDVFQVDTGAWISVAPVELANSLGIDVYNGTPVTLGGVFGQQEQGYIHSVDATMPPLASVTVPIAITANSSVPYILGRQGFLDQFNLQVQLSSSTFCLTKS